MTPPDHDGATDAQLRHRDHASAGTLLATSQRMMSPIARLDLAAEIESMRSGARANGHVAKTLVRSPQLRLVLMLLRRGAEIPVHQAEGALTIHVLEGRARLAAADDAHELVAGQLAVFEPGVPHAVAAIEDSAILLTIAWRGHDALT